MVPLLLERIVMVLLVDGDDDDGDDDDENEWEVTWLLQQIENGYCY